MAKGLSIHIGLNRVDPHHYQDQYGNPWDGALTACEFDANDMQAIAASQGFETQLLLSEQATSNAVVGAITQAAQELEAGDILLLTYAGHGGQVPDRNGEEEDDMDETWCCYDRQLVDDELYALWSQFKPGVRIFMLSDSCHSGTVARDPDQQAFAVAYGAPRVLPVEVQVETYKSNREFYDGLQATFGPAEQADIAASVILISGCEDDQSSADGQNNGLFTGTLKTVWGDGAFNGNLVHFWQSIRERMPVRQTPEYYRVGTPSREFERMRPFTI